MKAECLRQMNVLFMGADCIGHCLHLVVKDALKSVDVFLVDIGKSWKYYWTLTKVAQLWRDNAGDVINKWSNRYGQADAAKHVKTLCPHCVAGRWGSVAATENRLETIGIDRLHIVLSAVMIAKKSKGAAGSDHPPLKGPAEIAHDEMQAYLLKMGRWARDVVNSTSDMFFARVVAVMHRACAPIIHCSNLVKQNVSAEDELVYCCRMAQLISWDGARIAKEFDDLMLDPFWAVAADGLPEALNASDYTDEQFGVPTVMDIIAELDKPGRDPRPEFKTAVFQDGVEQLKDLRLNMVLEGVVTNVTHFGAFVDVGVHQDGLVHISALSHSFVEDPAKVVKAGDIVKVKVMAIDAQRKRIGLSMRLDDDAQSEPDSATPGGERSANRRGGSRNQAKAPVAPASTLDALFDQALKKGARR